MINNKLIEQLIAVLPAGLAIPAPLQQLYEWIEARGLFVDNEGGRVGFLYPEEDQQASWTEAGRRGGTNIEFAAEGSANLKFWFGAEHEEVNQRLCVFAQTGAEGSMGALWLDDAGATRIVHLGSGSGSTLTCVLADNAVDFLRLLAIGYDEICWSEEFPFPPNTVDPDFRVEPNVKFQEWVKTTFHAEIPLTASAIVKHPALMDDENSADEFFNWCQKYTG